MKSSAVLAACVVTGVAYVALTIPRFVRMEVAERRLAASRHRPMIAIARIEAVIYVAVKTMRAVKPRTGSEEYAANKPVRPVVAIRSAVIRSIVEVTIRAGRLNADADRYLRRGFCAAGGKQANSKSEETERFADVHF